MHTCALDVISYLDIEVMVRSDDVKACEVL